MRVCTVLGHADGQNCTAGAEHPLGMPSQGQHGTVRQVEVSRAQALQNLRRIASNPRFITFATLWLLGLLTMFVLPAPLPARAQHCWLLLA